MLLKESMLFTKEECVKIISYGDNNITNWKMPDRKYDSQFINYSVETQWVFDRLKIFFESETDIKIRNIKKQIHFHKYQKDDWFDRHNDDRDNRCYAVGVLLNDNFEGGEFTMYNPTKQHLNKEAGNSYIFDVKIEHEIKPILNGERYSILWFLQQPQHIKLSLNKLI